MQTTTYFLYEYVFTRYGLPIEIVSDRGTHFLNEVIHYLLDEFMVIHKEICSLPPTSKQTSQKHEPDSVHGTNEDCRQVTHRLGTQAKFNALGVLCSI